MLYFDIIPQELKQFKQWLLWKLENVNGRPSKVPYSITGRRASTTDPGTWGSFDEVKSKYEAGGYDGIGFVFTENDPFCAIDLDHCKEGGKIKKEAEEIIRKFNSYAEYSPSGEGVHIIIKAKLNGRHNRKGDIEIYDQKRYFTFTGQHIFFCPLKIEERQKELEEFYKEVFKVLPFDHPSSRVERENKEDRTINITKKLINDVLGGLNSIRDTQEFVDLFNGNWQGRYPSQSEADFVFVKLILKATNSENAVIALWLASKLYREKLEREDYIERTIKRAKEELRRELFREFEEINIDERIDINKDGIFTIDREPEPGDRSHAKILAMTFKEKLRWHSKEKRWYLWNGKFWEEKSEEGLIKMACERLKNVYKLKYLNTKEIEKIKKFIKYLEEAGKETKLKSAVNLLKGFDPILVEKEIFDQRLDLLNLENGVLNLNTFELEEHKAEYYFTSILPIKYDPQAKCPKWLEHLNLFIPDPEIQRQLQRDLGFALYSVEHKHFFHIWYGIGANGKSTTENILKEVFGTYCKQGAQNLFDDDRQYHHPTELADLKGGKLVFVEEREKNKDLTEAKIKTLTGGTLISARFMHGNFFTFRPTFLIVLVGNYKPNIKGTDFGIWDRVRLIPWNYTIPPEKRRPQNEVVAEILEEKSGILNWLLEGLKDWKADNSWRASDVKKATEEYRLEQDQVERFILSKCERDPHYTVEVKTLYEEYCNWCEEEKEGSPFSKRRFGEILKHKNLKQDREGKDRSRVWRGIRLKD